MTSSLYEAQDNLMKVIFGTDSSATLAVESYFGTTPKDLVFLYRDVVRNGIGSKIDHHFPRTKEFFTHIHGREKWHDLLKWFIEEHPPQNLSYLNLFEQFPRKIGGPEWLIELASYEATLSMVRSNEIRQTISNTLNQSIRLMRFRYNIPKWYQNWLDHELEIARSAEIENGNESIVLTGDKRTLPQKAPLPPSPKLKNDNLDPFQYVTVLKNIDDEIRIYSLSRLGFDFLTLLIQGYSFNHAQLQLLPVTGIEINNLTQVLKRYLSEFQIRGLFSNK